MSSRIRTALLILVATSALTSGFLASAQAAAASDIDLPPVSPSAGVELNVGISFSQTFTAGRSGVLSKVSLWMTTPGRVTNLTVRIFEAKVANGTLGNLPNLTETPLASKTLSNSELTALVPVSVVPGRFDVAFSPSPTITAGQEYAIVVTTNDFYNPYSLTGFKWWYASTFSNKAAYYYNNSSWGGLTGPFAFTTYIEDDAAAVDRPSNNSATPPTRALGFDGSLGTCTIDKRSALEMQWLQLPSASNCTRAGHTLLGWSTSAAFPVAVAKAQVDKGWGAIDDTFDGVRMIFIPAGGYTLLSGDNNLYEVWGPA